MGLEMGVTLKDILELAKEMPEECFETTYETLREIKDKAEVDKKSKPVTCLRRGSNGIARDGKRNGRQAYLCKNCGKTFADTSTSAIARSHSGKTVWKQVIRDTADGVSIDKTAGALDLARSTVFHMRHKILCRMEQATLKAHIESGGVREADETHVLESLKGREIPGGYHRKPRKRGAKASKPGLSDEYIRVRTSVDGDNNCTAPAVNRAMPSKAEIKQVFEDKVSADTVILRDGSDKYDVLEDKCTVAHSKRINRVNGFHSFIKGRLLGARRVAAAYLNRHDSLFANAYGKKDSAADNVFELMFSRDHSFSTIDAMKSQNLLTI
jgi:transposase-like protein